MSEKADEGFSWQVGVWDRMAGIYQQEIDTRFGPVIEHLLSRANLQSGETVLDLGTGTGSVAIAAATKLGPDGRINAVDISPEMLDKARARVQVLSLPNVEFAEGRAEAIPAKDDSLDDTASGTAVNLAARLCDQAEDGEVLLSPRAYRAVEDIAEVESAGELTLKGIQAPVDVVRVIRLKEDASGSTPSL